MASKNPSDKKEEKKKEAGKSPTKSQKPKEAKEAAGKSIQKKVEKVEKKVEKIEKKAEKAEKKEKAEKAEKTGGGPSEGKESKAEGKGQQPGGKSTKEPFAAGGAPPKSTEKSSKKKNKCSDKPTPTPQTVHIVNPQGPIPLTPADQKTLSDMGFAIGQPMRSGGFGMIYTATQGGPGPSAKPLVAKVIELAGLATTYVKEVNNWRDVWRNSPNINPALEIFELHEPDRMMVIMEPADFDLQDLVLKQPGWVSKKLAAQYYWQMNRGLSFMHLKNFAHRNLKPRNLLISKARGMELRLSDCGMSRVSFAATHPETTSNFAAWHETFGYLAPEVFSGNNAFCPMEADLWSVGAVLFFLLYKVVPFQTLKMDIAELSEKQKRLEVSKTGRLEPPEDGPQCRIEDALIQISLHFKVEPGERPTAKAVVDNPAHYGKWSNWLPSQAPGVNWVIPPNH